jgi:hypothetical protein
MDDNGSLGFLGERLQRIADQAGGFPFVHEDCAEPIVEINCGFIPVEHFPAHTEIFLAPGDPGDIRKEFLADSFFTELRANKNVFEK